MKKSTIPTHRHTAKGFTLMELMVVVAIIVILAGITLGLLRFVNAKQSLEQCNIRIKNLESSLDAYKMDNGTYPISEGSPGLAPAETGSYDLFKALYGDDNVGKKGTTKIYCEELNPQNAKLKWAETRKGQYRVIDPWGQILNYRSGTKTDGSSNTNAINPDFDLWSNGPDGKTNSILGNAQNKDNVTNWK